MNWIGHGRACGIAPRLRRCKRRGCARIDAILAEATLKRPVDRPHSWHGKRGQHSEHLGYIHRGDAVFAAQLSGSPLVNAVLPAIPSIRRPWTRRRLASIWQALAAVEDPEIPALSIVDLGLIRFVELRPTAAPRWVCRRPMSVVPRPKSFDDAVAHALRDAGVGEFSVTTVLSPAWSSDWITDAGRRKLQSYGIVPPGRAASSMRDVLRDVQAGGLSALP